MSPAFKFRRGRHVWLSFLWVSSLSHYVFPQVLRYSLPSRLKKKKFAKNGRRRTTMCGCRLPLNRYLMVIVFYLSFIIKPSEKFSNLMIIIIIHVNDQITATLSLLWYFVARESTSVMRQEQMMGGLISSIDVNCRICSCEFFLWFSSLRRKKTTAINSFHLRGPRSPLCYFFFCRCQHKKKFCLY